MTRNKRTYHKKHRRINSQYYIWINKITLWIVNLLIVSLCLIPLLFVKKSNMYQYTTISGNVVNVNNTSTSKLNTVAKILIIPVAGVVKAEKEFIHLPFAGVSILDETSPDVFTRDPSESVDNETTLSSETDISSTDQIQEVKNEQKNNTDDSEQAQTEATKTESVPSPSVYVNDMGESIVLNDEFISLCAVVHLEAGEGAPIEAKAAVGNVVMNRLKDSGKWGYSSIMDVLYAPNQFSVVHKEKFTKAKAKLVSQNLDDNLKASIMAAHLAYTGSSLYDIPDTVQYFYGDPNKRSWGKHSYWNTVGGNSFFQ